MTALRLGMARSRIELLVFFRNRQSVVFTLLLPVLLLIILGSIFSGEVGNTGVDLKQVFMAGIIAAGGMSVGFSGLAITMAIERDDGTIRRLGTTPMPKSAYFIGKVVLVLVAGILETLLLMAVATVFFGLKLPADADRWLTLTWVMLLGLASCALIAIAYSCLIPSARVASALVTPPFLVLQFISGVFFPFGDLPRWMQVVASAFPLKWMAQGLRSVFLPDSFQISEVGGSWQHPLTAIILIGWCVGGFVLSLMLFRWRGGDVS